MIKCALKTLILLMVPLVLYGQEPRDKQANTGDAKAKINTNIPAQSQYSHRFRITQNYFNRRIDAKGKGEILEVELVVENLTDDPLELYLFVIATFEKTEKTKSSLEMPVPEKERLRSFIPYPDDRKNFEYDHPDRKGEMQLLKYPKDPRAGVNPETGKPYMIKDKMIIRTYHLSPYRQNYFFFNNVTVLVFNAEGKPEYRQQYTLEGRRR